MKTKWLALVVFPYIVTVSTPTVWMDNQSGIEFYRHVGSFSCDTLEECQDLAAALNMGHKARTVGSYQFSVDDACTTSDPDCDSSKGKEPR